jgi:hypothetical protein
MSSGLLLEISVLRQLASLAGILLLHIVDNVVNRFVLRVFGETLHVGQRGLLEIYFVFFAAKHALMVYEDFLGKAFEDPFVLKSFEWGHAVHRVPVKALVDKV